MSEALPPLDEHDLAVVAEGFERLDRRRAELAALEAELTEVHALARASATMHGRCSLALLRRVRAAESRRDAVTRTEREARGELAVARHEAATVEAELGVFERAGRPRRRGGSAA